jgi:uncharacterized repeat protein (TIGR03843 family)
MGASALGESEETALGDPGRATDSDREHALRTIDIDTALRALSRGRMTVIGQIMASSNYAFLARIEHDDLQALAVYKPRRGEIPLWDFPSGTLCVREVAAYVLSRALGWPKVPPTVLRDGVYGPGMLQLFIDCDPQDHYFTFRDERSRDLIPVALFDLLTNNADRKGGHLLLDREGTIWAIDHALTFHTEPKLRTVIWDFAGEAVPPEYLDDLSELVGQLAPGTAFRGVMGKLVTEGELDALSHRAEAVVEHGRFPVPDPERRQIPWPPV